MGVSSLKTEHTQLISMLRARMNGDKLPKPDDSQLAAVALAARQHKLEPFVYQWLMQYPQQENSILPEMAFRTSYSNFTGIIRGKSAIQSQINQLAVFAIDQGFYNIAMLKRMIA